MMKKNISEIKVEIKSLRKEIEILNKKLLESNSLKEKKKIAVSRVKELRGEYNLLVD